MERGWDPLGIGAGDNNYYRNGVHRTTGLQISQWFAPHQGPTSLDNSSRDWGPPTNKEIDVFSVEYVFKYGWSRIPPTSFSRQWV